MFCIEGEDVENLSELSVLEQFKESIPDSVAQHINDLNVRTGR